MISAASMVCNLCGESKECIQWNYALDKDLAACRDCAAGMFFDQLAQPTDCRQPITST